MGHVVIAAASADRDAGGRLAALLRRAGWSVRTLTLGADAPDVRFAAFDDIPTAQAVLLVWSAQAGQGLAPPEREILAAAADRLVLVRTDAAAAPLEAPRMVDLSDLPDLDGAEAERALVAVVGSPISATPDSGAPGIAPGKPGGQRGLRLIASALVALVVVAGVAGAGVWVLTAGDGGGGVGVAASGSRPAPASEPPGETADVRPPEDSRGEWREALANGPGAIRGFIARSPEGALREEARAALDQLDAEAWAHVESGAHAAEVLDRISTYRLAFPDGAFREQVQDAERRERERIARIRAGLAALGLLKSAEGGLDPDAIAAVRALQRSAGLPPTGRFDETVETALGVKAGMASAASAAASNPASLAEANARPPGTIFRDCYVCPEMVVLPTGSFIMGDESGAAPPDERPAHAVAIAYRLAVGRYEVTREEWSACVGDGGCRRLDDGAADGRLPAGGIAPADANAYLAWLGAKTGEAYRLLSEAEWEYAARAGTRTAWVSGNAAADICAHANGADRSSSHAWRNTACSDGEAALAPVGRYRPNAFGLHDMSGNLWEWTADCWHGAYIGAPSDGSAWTTECEGAEQVLRGGAYSVDVDKLRSSFRYRFAARPMPFFGFRVARLVS